MDFVKLYKFFEQEPRFRVRQMEKAVFYDALEDWDEVTVFPKDMRDKLKLECPLVIKVDEVALLGNTVQKALFDFNGDKVEAVLMRHFDRNTVCVSSQVGCAFACKFCATGKMGFSRNLTAWEIVHQVLFFKRMLKKETVFVPNAQDPGGEKEKISNIVFMGMGEPLQNYEAVMKALRVFNDSEKFGIGARKISISTVGVLDGIKKLSKEAEQVNLAVSLHAPSDELRSQLMPINRTYPLKQLLGAIKNYVETTKRKVMIEYVMLCGINDSEDQARELARLLKDNLGYMFMVNLITYNQTGEFKPSSSKQVKRFKQVLEQERIKVVQRYRFGQDIKAACGQLFSIKN